MSNLSDNLLSALQGASNAAASNVSGPVDALAWALRKVGVPVPSNAFGGSEWMRQQGLTAEPKNKLSGLLGEGVGLAAPFAIAAKAPQIAGGLLKADDALAAGANRMADHFERTGAAYRYDPRQRGSVGAADAAPSRGPAASAEWAGTNTPARIGEGYASDMMGLVKEDIAAKDFDPAMIRQGLIEWSQKGGIHPGHSLRSFMRQLNADTSITPARKQKILASLVGQQ